MAIAPHIRRLRQLVGNELLVLPSVAVFPMDGERRVLLVRTIDTEQWAAIGGAVEPDESPRQAALREAEEEAGVVLRLGSIRAVLGGPAYRMTYPNGDRTSYVSTVFDAQVIGGVPRPDGDETSAVQWWDTARLPAEEMSPFTRALIRDARIASRPGERTSRPPTRSRSVAADRRTGQNRPMQPLGVHHVSVNVPDVDTNVAFYVDVLGGALRDDRPELGIGGAWLDFGGQQVHLVEAPPPTNAGQHFALRVADLAATVDELRSKGVAVGEPMSVGTNRQTFITDPAGNTIELHQVGAAG
ncbi:MAG TPA: NUDIX domain-containing protein [Acidimicrobiales bacterium]|jgi:ADP-ribose pyrophosphatase YjhB (NUDIX family)/catechol 2,3-dioxygenase-like lactoylglutathione lyase family enzyme|nr:NUDIX domain-containing protein [Acidimicrobiales bacterium]